VYLVLLTLLETSEKKNVFLIVPYNVRKFGLFNTRQILRFFTPVTVRISFRYVTPCSLVTTFRMNLHCSFSE
jgi:hypothetical protein